MSELDTSGFVTVEVGGAPEAAPADPPAQAAEDPNKPQPGEDAADLAERLKEQEGITPKEGEDQPEGEQPPKKKQTAQERIDELTRARREAEREAAHWRDVANGKAPKQPGNGHDKAPEEASPDPKDYDLGETDPLYIRDFIAHEVKKGVDAAQRGMAQDLHIQAEERAWEARQDAARSDFADYDQVVSATDPETGAPKWPCSQDMAAAIRTSDAGGYLAYHLASNPEEARRISALDPHSQVRELGKLEATLEAGRKTAAQPPESDKPKPKTATDAPKPPENQARGAGGRFEVAPDTDDFAAFEQTYGSKFGTA